MKLPSQFQLGGVIWRVEQASPLIGAYGATFPGLALIQIDKELSKQLKEQTFIHELIHACLFSMGRPVDQHDEVIVDGLATMLHQFFQTYK